jgi:hypothetical protein
VNQPRSTHVDQPLAERAASGRGAPTSMTMPISIDDRDDATLALAHAHYRAHLEVALGRVAEKRPLVQNYDIAEMQDAVAICHWGRSGTLLLASFLDGHEDIIAMPRLMSGYIYEFYEDYAFLTLWEKLLAYPTYAGLKDRTHASFFPQGDSDDSSAVQPVDYYSSVHALFDAYSCQDGDPAWARRRFFQFLHVAYAVAVGRRSQNKRPLMIYAQHSPSDELARRFVEDFPNGRFIHTVRDPISTFDSWLGWHFTHQFGSAQTPLSEYRFPAFDAVRQLLAWDCAQAGMAERTRAVRFEDLHLHPAETMRHVADWLRIPYRPSMLESTFDGKPYVVRRGNLEWSGSRPANAQRKSDNLGLADRLMIFALLHRNFVAWSYASPRILQWSWWIRLCLIVLLSPVPMKMESRNARIIVRLSALPNLRRGQIIGALSMPLRLVKRRLLVMRLILTEAIARTRGRRRLLELL